MIFYFVSLNIKFVIWCIVIYKRSVGYREIDIKDDDLKD